MDRHAVERRETEDPEVGYVALVGPPNSGKTTLFNWLTGRRQKVVNYPGSTVDITTGPLLESLYDSSRPITIVDTPGTYSLFPKSQDEEITNKTLFNGLFRIRKVVLVLDSTQIARQLHLVRQLQEAGFSIVVAVTMHDLHLKEKSEIDVIKLSKLLGLPACAIDGVLGGGVRDLVKTLTAQGPGPENVNRLKPWSLQRLQEVYKEGEQIANAVTRKELKIFYQTETKDKLLLHPVWGSIIFILIMMGLFSSIYWAAAPLMDLVDSVFGWLASQPNALLGTGLLSSLLGDGVIAGLGAVMVFVPQIFILFVGISILEDTGYLARAATIVDKPLSKIGLNGKAFVPILSGFACAVPAIMATRSIQSEKERRIATFIIPFMTCSARLPVYALLLSFVFFQEPLKAGLALTLLYLGGIVVGALASAILNKLVVMKSPSFFLMELPIYRRPKLKVVFRNSLRRTSAYIYKTGPIILVLSMCLWALSTFPHYQEQDDRLRLEKSYAAQIGQVMEPLFEPMGADWRVGVGLISAFAAREVFVSSLAVVLNVADSEDLNAEDESSLRAGLLEKMRSATWPDGRALFTLPSVVALLLFFMLALQCISTSATARRETGSTRFAWIQLISMNVFGYLVAVIAYSVMS